jgi:hypothetical protein
MPTVVGPQAMAVTGQVVPLLHQQMKMALWDLVAMAGQAGLEVLEAWAEPEALVVLVELAEPGGRELLG